MTMSLSDIVLPFFFLNLIILGLSSCQMSAGQMSAGQMSAALPNESPFPQLNPPAQQFNLKFNSTDNVTMTKQM